MVRIAEYLRLPESNIWKIAQQCGVEFAVAGLPTDLLKPGERVCDLAPLSRMKDLYAEHGFTIEVIEQRPPLNKAKRGLPGRDEEIDVACALIENMGKLGIPVWCYEWMPDFTWFRTDKSVQSRGNSLVTAFDAKDIPAEIRELPPISTDALWENLEYFLKRVLPVAEKAGVKLSMHPDDPPISPIGQIGRIMGSIENYQRLLQLVPSEMNTITMCQGNFTLMTDDLPAEIEKFGKKISFVHFRDVEGVPEKFVETWHDCGQTDMLACMKAYKKIGFDGVLRPDHVPTVAGDTNDHAGYSAFGRLYAIGYIRGLRQSVFG